jgi:tRNA-2-methylthio-N6-dimethylallyladenosine synthase
MLENLRGRTATGRGERPAWSRENLSTLGQTDGSRTEAGGLVGFVTIMQGCDNYCAYCVVPYLRGPELSRTAGDIVDEVKRLIDNGVRDLTLLGQNVNSYGRGLAGAPSFPELLEKVADTGIERLRFTTSHPKDFSPELVCLFGRLGPLCESLHLPVQSGSDKILGNMRRVYSRDSYLRLVDSLRAQCPDLALSTDIIVGFPGETDKDFADTLSLVEAVGYDAMFSFKYSDRPQTASISFENKVPEEEKGRRLTVLQARQKEITLAKNAAHVGQVMEVLVERESERYAGQLTGRARNFKLIHLDGPPNLIGQTVPVRVEEAWGASLRGVNIRGQKVEA